MFDPSIFKGRIVKINNVKKGKKNDKKFNR